MRTDTWLAPIFGLASTFGVAWIFGLVWTFSFLMFPCRIQAQTILDFGVDQPSISEADEHVFNFPSKTMGGQQFWTDVRFYGGWHIQRNVVTQHYRLLDPTNVRRAWGSLQHCQQVLQDRIDSGEIRGYHGKVVIALHGLMRTHRSMQPLCNNLQQEHGFEVINFEYASGRATVQDHAKDLAQVIEHLGPEVHEISFVAHSLGSIVVRNYLFQLNQIPEESNRENRLRRMVMLGPPNQGSRLAKWFSRSLAFYSVAGASGRQLSRNWANLETELATPDFPFAIIAGGSDTANIYERTILDGPSDLVVSVEETQLPGASEMLVLPVAHTFMMQDPQVMQAVANFLQTGKTN